MATDASGGVPEQPVSEPIHIDSESHLEDVVSTYDVVLVDFFATWCGPCKMLEPVLEDLAAGTDGVIAKVDVDENQELAGTYGVRGVPTLALFAGGEQVQQQTGALPEEKLRELIESHTD